MNNSSVSLRKPLALLGVGLSLFAAQAAFAQPTPTAETKEEAVQLEKFEVTGSRLTGAAVEGSLSVSLYKMDDLQNTGYSNFGELLRKKLPQFGGGVGTINEAFGNGGSGQATISLRNLPLSRTLFLVNGRRTNADINMIPDIAIESIEVLNDGASAVYGSDAVAGVVNVKFKRNFEGGQFTARYANTTDTDVGESRFGLVWGSKLGEKTNITAAVEHYERNLLMHYEREVSVPAGDSVSGTSNPGLLTPVSTAAQRLAANATQSGDPGHVAGVTNTNVLVPLRWFVNTSGAALTSASQVPAGFVPNAFLTAPSSLSVTARNALRDAEERARSTALGANAIVQYGPNRVMLPGVNPGFPFGYYTYAFRPQESTKISFTSDTQISETLSFFADLLLSQNESSNALAPSPLSGRTVATTNYWYNQVFPAATAAGNNLGFAYRPIELGSRITYNTFEDVAFTGGFRGNVDKWNYEIAYLRDEWKQTQVQTGGVLSGVYNTALAASTSTGAFNPFVFTPFLTQNAAANTALLPSLGGSGMAIYRYLIDQIDGNVTGDLMDLPAGPLKVSVGAEWRKESQDDRPDSNLINGTVFPFNTESPFASQREVVSYYAETDIPIIKNLNIQLAGRYEDYSDAGETGFKPRVSFSWKPIGDELNIHGSWAQGFVAPAMSSLTADAPSQSFTELFNPVTGVRTQATQGSIFIGNPGLLPAESDSYLAGFTYSPKAVKGLSVGINYYRIEETAIPFTSDQYIVNQWYAAGPTNASNPFGPTATPSAQNPLGSQVSMNVDGSLQQVRNVGPINSGDRMTDGWDFFASYYQDTTAGRFTLETSWTLVTTFEQENFPGDGTIDYLGYYWSSGSALGNYGFPELKGSFNLYWKKDRYAASAGWNYVDGYLEEGNDNNPIPSYDTFDIRLSYMIPKVEAELTVGCNNIFDEQPPFIATSFETQSDRAITDIRGRMLFVELSKKF
jgi:iron complex outermembrane receptor protein